jgi:lipopolysaccharide/colanic/teichoic acid biosynthesis glycosyltransferase
MLPSNQQQYAAATRGIRGYLQRVHNLHDPDRMRRLADMVIACALLTVTVPLMLLVALAIKFEGPGPIFDRHSCIGRGGRRFQMLSFRTIAHDPQETLPIWARKPTQLGQFLRSTRIEVLPRIINVLRGEMSIIDPDGSSPSFLD